ncbi:hypothetical protein K3495_g8455 [Podosphaera aphanis]|nr:hypothetical protein K3495_g8455 [Podosphaera aphanis]
MLQILSLLRCQFYGSLINQFYHLKPKSCNHLSLKYILDGKTQLEIKAFLTEFYAYSDIFQFNIISYNIGLTADSDSTHQSISFNLNFQQAVAHARIGGSNGQTRDQAKIDFLTFLRTVPLQDIVVYTDGSKQPDGSAGAGFVAHQGGMQILHQSLGLGKGNEVFDAESKGALAGAKAALALPSTKFAHGRKGQENKKQLEAS